MKTKRKNKFLYNSKNSKHNYDIFNDKNPKDTIPIKYKTLDDLKNTINNLEKLYKSKKYTHKRISQVGLILNIRLKLLKDKKPNEYILANKYFTFLQERTKLNENDRYKLTFTFGTSHNLKN